MSVRNRSGNNSVMIAAEHVSEIFRLCVFKILIIFQKDFVAFSSRKSFKCHIIRQVMKLLLGLWRGEGEWDKLDECETWCNLLRLSTLDLITETYSHVRL